MRKTNINATLKMTRQYPDGEMSHIDCELDFSYEVEKRYQKMCKEDESHEDMLYYYLIECNTEQASGKPVIN